MRPASRLPPVLACILLGGCSIVVGGRIEACGEYPEGGGPAVIVTRDQELCEVVRLRVLQRFDAATDLTRSQIDSLIDKSFEWQRKSTIDALLAAVRRDAGDVVADEVRRAVDSVAASSTRNLRPDCEDVEKCMVKGAAHGLRIALLYARPSAPSNSATDGDPAEKK